MRFVLGVWLGGWGGVGVEWHGMSGENREIPKEGTPQAVSGQFSFLKQPLLPAPGLSLCIGSSWSLLGNILGF